MKPPSPRKILGSIAVLAVSITTGILFGVSAQTGTSRESTFGLDLPQLVLEKQGAIAEAEETNTQLASQIEFLIGDIQTIPANMVDSPFLAKSLTGPGVLVELTDAPADLVSQTNVNPNDLVVHQEDVNAVMNALWRGGAEAMAVQGIRITPRTPVRCIGNVILVGGSVFSPPYRIEAIGDPQYLVASVNGDPQIEIYQQYVRAYGIGWRMEAQSTLTLPPLSESLSFKFANQMQGS